jgi:hypothetical protein
VVDDGFNDVLGAYNLFQITMRVVEEPAQPLLAALRAREVELMKNRKLFLGMENGNIVECNFIDLHDLNNWPQPIYAFLYSNFRATITLCCDAPFIVPIIMQLLAEGG